MSIPVPLPDLPDTMSRFGLAPYLLTVGPDATPHAASVTVEWSEGRLLAGAGRRTAANLRSNEALALLWPPPSPGDYSLIVDGWGAVRESGPHLVVMIQPMSAVLHVTARSP
ncbi:MAG TPA: hypothetical protein VET24_06545 [Actinomycetota bacterium]|nr:hypothetical protein [Actinomycetota bacterium]